MVKPGNVDLSKRPLVHHKSGGVSTLYSGSFEDEGKVVVVPFVSPTGEMLNDKQALALYKKTGQNLGTFKTEEDATKYSIYLHQKQGAFQTWKNGGKYNPSVETYDDWKE